MQLKILTATVVLTSMLLTGCEETKDETKMLNLKTEQIEASEVQKLELDLKDTSNQSYHVSITEDGIDVQGVDSNKIILFNFFATYCPPCRAEVPHLINLQNRYKENLQIVSILLEDKDIQTIKSFINQHGINYKIIAGGDRYDFAKVVYQALHAPASMPIPLMTLFYKGKYQQHYIGGTPEAMIESDIKQILGQ